MISVVNALANFMNTRAATLLLLFVALINFSACSSPKDASVKLAGFTMGTSYHITIVGDELDADALQEQVDKQLAQLNQTFSTYIDDSELSLLNQAEVGVWHPVSHELYEVLALSQQLAAVTEGAFDITIAPLVNAWGFGPDKSVEKPSDETVHSLLQQVGYQHLVLEQGQVKKQRAITVDLSAVAKGYAVDQLASLLRQQGAQNFMVEIGGELYLQGQSPRGTPWRIAIEEPGEELSQVHRAVEVENKAVATSGDYRNYYEVEGKRYSHTLNPVTGKPITHKLASVTVIADDCASADAIATAVNVLGATRGLELAQQEGWAIYLIVKSGEGFNTLYSDDFETYLN
jgi:thiamine biosynthesis lipoprotein